MKIKLWIIRLLKKMLNFFENNSVNQKTDNKIESIPAEVIRVTTQEDIIQAKNKASRLQIKIEEFPNENIICYHINESLTDMCWSFETQKDLKFGGLHSINFEKVEVPEELQYLAGAFLMIDGIIKVDFNRYQIRMEKSPVFDWPEIEKEALALLKSLVAKKREIFIKERTRMSLDGNGCAIYTKI